ncbi:MAG TPA: NUDIX hydrolase, partial [Anaerolineae bacterium]|nr:NUDIX hydrolase [Anaerolineae bacterium]
MEFGRLKNIIILFALHSYIGIEWKTLEIVLKHPFDWQLLTTNYIIEEPWLSFRVDRFQMPNGRIVDPYYIIESRDWVNVVAVTLAEEIILVRLYRPGIQKTILEIPGGVVDGEDESLVTAVSRELLEETGYHSDDITLVGQGAPDPARYDNYAYYFLARNARKVAEPAWDENEEMEILLTPIPEVIEMLLDGRIQNGMQQNALFYALAALGKMRF